MTTSSQKFKRLRNENNLLTQLFFWNTYESCFICLLVFGVTGIFIATFLQI